MKKIFFLGTPQIAIPSLEAIHDNPDYDIVGVGVFPDRKVGRKQILTPCPVKKRALELELPVLEIPDKETLVKITKTLDFDIGIVIAFGLIFPAEILVDKKFINVHFSLLPKYRGASPVQSAILDGQKTSGITWQIMAQKLDAGDILYQKSYPLKAKTTATCWEFFATETACEFKNFLDKYFQKQLTAIPQNELEATFCGKCKKSDGEINFKTMTAEAIFTKYKAFDVWPGIFVKTEKGPVKCLTLSCDPLPDSIEVPCKNGTTLFLQMIQIPGKKPGNAKQILQNNPHLWG